MDSHRIDSFRLKKMKAADLKNLLMDGSLIILLAPHRNEGTKTLPLHGRWWEMIYFIVAPAQLVKRIKHLFF